MGWGKARAVIAAAIMIAAVAEGATAQTAGDAAPTWLKKIRAEDLISVWPVEAFKRGLGGKAVIHCKVSAQGSLFDCRVMSETPPGAGFGKAALALTPQLLMRPATKDGKAVVYDGVTLPITFDKPDIQTGSHLPGVGALTRFKNEVLLSGVNWVTAPSYGEVVAAYPGSASKARLGGRGLLQCRFKSVGQLASCEIVSEEPRGGGFGQAARKLAPLFRGPAIGPNGSSTEGAYVQIPITFTPAMLDAQQLPIGKPQWTSLPSLEQFKEAFPKVASEKGVLAARVVLLCSVALDGSLTACRVESEDPAGYGFGAATLPLASGFRLGVWSAEGLPVVGGQVRVPIRYQLEQAVQPPAKKP